MAHPLRQREQALRDVKAGTDHQPVTTGGRAKPRKRRAAKTKPAGKAKGTKVKTTPKGAARPSRSWGTLATETWADKSGSEIVVGSVIVEPVKGTVRSPARARRRTARALRWWGSAPTSRSPRTGAIVNVPTFRRASACWRRRRSGDPPDWINPRASIEGWDGNAFAVLGYTASALRSAGNSDEVVASYPRRGQLRRLDHLLHVSMVYCGMLD